jgi:hypothetical protein
LSIRYLRKTFLEFFRISLQRFLTLFELLTDNSEIKINKYKTISEKIKIEQFIEANKQVAIIECPCGDKNKQEVV